MTDNLTGKEIVGDGEDFVKMAFDEQLSEDEETIKEDLEGLSDEEKERRALQAERDRLKHEKEALEQKVNLISEKFDTVMQVVSKGGVSGEEKEKEILKVASPVQLMPEGVEYNAYEADIPGTDSFNAKQKFEEYREERLLKRISHQNKEILIAEREAARADSLKREFKQKYNATDEDFNDFLKFVNSPDALSPEEMYRIFLAKNKRISKKVADNIERNNQEHNIMGNIIDSQSIAPKHKIQNKIDKQLGGHFPDDTF